MKAPWPAASAVVADDLTGAMDTGVQVLETAAAEVEVTPGGGSGIAPPAGTLLVSNTQSRGTDPHTAAARVGDTCARLGRAGRVVWFKKLDSTLRGNVGAELAAMHAALAPCVIVGTPALPAEGRTVVDGVLRVHGQPVMATPYRDEIAAHGAAGSSAVIDIIRRQWPACRARQLAAPVSSRDLAAAVHGAVDLLVVDAASDAHLQQLAVAGSELARRGSRLLWAGAAGLLRALVGSAPPPASAAGSRGRHELPPALPPALPLVLVAGSRRTLAHAQLRHAGAVARSRSLMLRLEPEPRGAMGSGTLRWQVSGACACPAAIADSTTAAARAAAAMSRGRDLLLSAAPPGAPYDHPEAVSEALASLAGDIVDAAAARPQTLLLVGGDTAYACLRRLGIRALALAGEAEPYVPWGRVTGGTWAGTVVITKAGGFGDPYTLQRIYSRLHAVT